MRDDVADPRCPECGEPIGQTATYCMHCSADLTEERAAADADGDGAWDTVADASPVAAESTGATGSSTGPGTTSTTSGRTQTGVGRTIEEFLGVAGGEHDDQLLDPDGFVDDSLTVLVGILGGIVVGVLATIVLGFVTGSGYALLLGFVAWLCATAYLVRRRTVQGALAASAHGVAIALLSVPVIALSPVVDVDGGLADRGVFFVFLLVVVAIPASIAVVIGQIAAQYVPEEDGGDGAQ